MGVVTPDLLSRAILPYLDPVALEKGERLQGLDRIGTGKPVLIPDNYPAYPARFAKLEQFAKDGPSGDISCRDNFREDPD